MRLRRLYPYIALIALYLATYIGLRLTHVFLHREWWFNEYARSHFIKIAAPPFDSEAYCKLHYNSLLIYYPLQVIEVWIWYQIKPLSTQRRHHPKYLNPTSMDNDWDAYVEVQNSHTPYN